MKKDKNQTVYELAWEYWTRLNFPGVNEFYLKAASRLDELVVEVVKTFWRLFNETCEVMEEANQVLIKSAS